MCLLGPGLTQRLAQVGDPVHTVWLESLLDIAWDLVKRARHTEETTRGSARAWQELPTEMEHCFKGELVVPNVLEGTLGPNEKTEGPALASHLNQWAQPNRSKFACLPAHWRLWQVESGSIFGVLNQTATRGAHAAFHRQLKHGDLDPSPHAGGLSVQVWPQPWLWPLYSLPKGRATRRCYHGAETSIFRTDASTTERCGFEVGHWACWAIQKNEIFVPEQSWVRLALRQEWASWELPEVDARTGKCHSRAGWVSQTTPVQGSWPACEALTSSERLKCCFGVWGGGS